MLIAEHSVKSPLAYHFKEIYGENQQEYLALTHYAVTKANQKNSHFFFLSSSYRLRRNQIHACPGDVCQDDIPEVDRRLDGGGVERFHTFQDLSFGNVSCGFNRDHGDDAILYRDAAGNGPHRICTFFFAVVIAAFAGVSLNRKDFFFQMGRSFSSKQSTREPFLL